MPNFKRKKTRRVTKGKQFPAMETMNAAPPPGLFQPVPLGSRTFQNSILPVLQSSYLYPESESCFLYSGAQLVNCATLRNEYQAFHAEKLEKGYTEEELRESFGFLLFDEQEKAKDVCKSGLRVGQSTCSLLGDPSKGVYVSKHSDCLGHSSWCRESSGFIVILRLTMGHLKPVRGDHAQGVTTPTPEFDCHVWEELSEELTPSSVPPCERMQYYLYEPCGEAERPVVRPRHVLPFALVEFSYGEATPSSQEHSGAEKLAVHCHPWRGQIQIKSLVYYVALRSNTATLTPVQLPAAMVADSVVSVSVLRKLLPDGIFETCFDSEVSLQGWLCGLYEVVTSVAEDAFPLAVLTQELKQKELALVLQLDGFGFLLLLSSSYFLMYQDPLLGKPETLLAMLVFPDKSRALQEGSKILRSRASILQYLPHIIPGLNYAETEVEKCPPDQQGALCELVEQHLKSYATLDGSSEASCFNDSYDTTEMPNHPYSAPKCGERTLQRLQAYLDHPKAYTLPVVRAMEVLAVRREEQGSHSDKDAASASGVDRGVTGHTGEEPTESTVESTDKVRGYTCVQGQGGPASLKLIIRPATSKKHGSRRSKKRRKVPEPASQESLGQDGGTEIQPATAQPLTPKRKGFGYGLKTIITDCGQVFVPHGSAILPKDIASLEARLRVGNQSAEDMVCESLGAPTLPGELADQHTPKTETAGVQAPNTEVTDRRPRKTKMAEEEAPPMDPTDRLEMGPTSTTVSCPVEHNHIKNSGTKIIPDDDISVKEVPESKPLITFKELRTVFQRIRKKLKCPDSHTLGKSEASLTDGEPQQKKRKSNVDMEIELQGSDKSCGKDVSPRGTKNITTSPKMTKRSDLIAVLLGKPQRTVGQEGMQVRTTSPRKLDHPKSSLHSDQPLQTLESHASPTTRAKLLKDKLFKKQPRSRITESTTESESLYSDSPSSYGSETIVQPQYQESILDGLQVSPGGVSPILEPDSTSDCQRSDALTLLADLALSSSGDKTPTKLSPTLEVNPSARGRGRGRGRGRTKRDLPLRSPTPEGLVVSGEFILIISQEHSYSGPPSSKEGLTDGPHQLTPQSVVEISPPSGQQEPLQYTEPLGQENTNQPKATNQSLNNVPSPCGVAERRKRASKRARNVLLVGERIQVTRKWKDTYEFDHDSKYTSEPLVKAVLRGLHGPWDFSIQDNFQQTHLILHTWIGLFYSKSTTRFFQTDPNGPILEPLTLKSRKKSQTKEDVPSSSPSSEVLRDTTEMPSCTPPAAPLEGMVLDLREESKKVADPSVPCSKVLDLSQKCSEALDLSVVSKRSSEMSPWSSTLKNVPKNPLIPLPSPTCYNSAMKYPPPLPSTYLEFSHKERRPSTGILSDDGSEQRDDRSSCHEDDVDEKWDSANGFCKPDQPMSTDDVYTHICEHTASLYISKDKLFSGKPRGTKLISGGTFRSNCPLQLINRERERRTRRTIQGSPYILPCRLSYHTATDILQPINIYHTATEALLPVNICHKATEALQLINICPTAAEAHQPVSIWPTAAEALQPISICHSAAETFLPVNLCYIATEVLQPRHASDYESNGTEEHHGNDFSGVEKCSAVHDGTDFSIGQESTALHDGTDISGKEAFRAVHGRSALSKEEPYAAVHDGTNFSVGQESTALHDGTDISGKEACKAVHVGSDLNKEEPCTAVHDGRDISEEETCTAVHDGTVISEGETCTAVHDGTDFSKEEACTAVIDGNDFSMDEESTAVRVGSDVIQGEELKAVCDLNEMNDGSSGDGEEMPTAVFDGRSDSVTEKQKAFSTGDDSSNDFHLEGSASDIRSPTPTLDELPFELNLYLSGSQSGTPVSDASCLNSEEPGSRNATPTQDEVPCVQESHGYDSFSLATESVLGNEADPISVNGEVKSSAYLPGNESCPSSKCVESAPTAVPKPFSISSPALDQDLEDSHKPQPLSGDCTSFEEVTLCREPKSSHMEVFKPHGHEEPHTANDEGITISKENRLPRELPNPDSLPRNVKASCQSEPTADAQSPRCSDLSPCLSSSLVSEASPQDGSFILSKGDRMINHSELSAFSCKTESAENDYNSDPKLASERVHPPSPHSELGPTENSLSARDRPSSEGSIVIEDSQQSLLGSCSDSRDGNKLDLLESCLEVIQEGNHIHLLRQDSELCHSVTSPQSKLQADCLHHPNQPFSEGEDVSADHELLSDSNSISQSKCSNSPSGSGSDCTGHSVLNLAYREHEPTGTSAPTGNLQLIDQNCKKCFSPTSAHSRPTPCRPHSPGKRFGKSNIDCRSQECQGVSDISLAMIEGQMRSLLSMEDSSDPAALHTAAGDLSKCLAQKKEDDKEWYDMEGDRESISSGSFFEVVGGEDAEGRPVGEDSFDEQEICEALDYSKSGPFNHCSAEAEGTGWSRSCSNPQKNEERDRFRYRRGGSKGADQIHRHVKGEENKDSAIRPSIFTVLDDRGKRRTYENYPITKKVSNEPARAAQDKGKGSSHLHNFLQKWEEPQHMQPDLTQMSLDLQYLIFSEKMNQILKKNQLNAQCCVSARYPWRKCSPSQVDCSPCGGPVTLQFCAFEDCIFKEPPHKQRSKGDDCMGLRAPEASTKSYVMDHKLPQRLRRLSHARGFVEPSSSVSNITVKCARSYRAMMNDLCSGKKPLQQPSRFQRKRTLQPHRKYSSKQVKGHFSSSLHSNFKAPGRLFCEGKFRFYILVTSADAFFEETKELLEAEGHVCVDPDQFDLEGRSPVSPLLIILRNEDIADHISTIPHLLELKKTPGVLFAGVDRPDDVLKHAHQELFRQGGFIVCDTDALGSFTLDDVKKLVRLLEELNERSRWKWLLHYRDSRELRESARRSPASRRLKQLVDRCQEAGFVEGMPYHECDIISRDRPDYLSCLLRLQVQHTTARFPVFITDTPEDFFEKCGILAMNLNTFSCTSWTDTFTTLRTALAVDF